MKKITMAILIITLAITGLFADERSDAIEIVSMVSPGALQAILDRAVSTHEGADAILFEIGDQCIAFIYTLETNPTSRIVEIITENQDYKRTDPRADGLDIDEIPTDWVGVQYQILKEQPSR